MIETQTKFKKFGGSIGLIIPSHIVKLLHIESNQEVKISINDEKTMILEVKKPKKGKSNAKFKYKAS